MSLSEQIRIFLKNFNDKKKIWEILFRDDRGKNAQTLLQLEIRPFEREKIIDSVIVEDYSEGPLEDKLNQSADMWVFGKIYKGKMIYIKIAMGLPINPVICISFHEAEYKMKFPLKK